MSKFEITCPSCGMILELRHDGMQKCKYCSEQIYIIREDDRIIVRNISQKMQSDSLTNNAYRNDSNINGTQYYDKVYDDEDKVQTPEKMKYIDDENYDDDGKYHNDEYYNDESDYDEDYDDLKQGEENIPPELLSREKKKKQKSPLRIIIVLFMISFALFHLISEIQDIFKPKINHNDFQTERRAPRAVQKSIAQEVSSPHMVKFAEAMFGKKMDKITQSDYERVKYLKVVMPEFDSQFFYVEYALDELDFMDEFQVIDREKLRKSQKIKRVDIKIEGKNSFFLPIYDFQPFSNLVVLDLKDSEIMVDFFGDHEQYEYHLKNLKNLNVLYLPQNERIESVESILTDLEQLTSLTGELYHAETLSAISYRFENLRELRILRFDNSELKDMSFLSEMENLQTLEVPMFEDNSYLSGLKTLKKLILNAERKERNYDVLKQMGHLESLEIKSGGTLKSIDFLEALPNLKAFRITDSEIASIEVLKKLPLEELILERNMELKDYSPIEQLKELKILRFSSWWPDKGIKLFKVGQLPNLKRLETMGGWVSKLGKSQTIEELTLIGSIGDEIYLETIPKMPAVKTLNFVDEAQLFNASALEKLSALKEVRFYKTRLQYFDLAELFNLKGIEKISFSKVESFAIDLNELQTNESLKSLSMESSEFLYLILHSNNNVDKKPHKLAEHTELFTKLQGLEELVLFNCDIKDATFRKKMPNLKRLVIDETLQ